MTEASGSSTFEGGCLCGAVRFRVAGPLRKVVYCHCEQCRRTSGHFVAATGADRNAIEMTEDAGLRWFASSESAKRGFCVHCGSSLFWQRNDSDHTSIMAGAIDDKNALTADRHIYVADKGSYYPVDDGLSRFEQSD